MFDDSLCQRDVDRSIETGGLHVVTQLRLRST